MRPNLPLILAVLCLAAGLTVIFHYGVGSATFNAAYPFSAANLQLTIATAGPAAIGGIVLTAVGALLMLWAFFCALIGMFGGPGSEPAEALTERRGARFERARLEQELKFEETERKALEQDRIVHEDVHAKASALKE